MDPIQRMFKEEMIQCSVAPDRNTTGSWGFCSCVGNLRKYIMHHFQGSSIKTQPGLTGEGSWNQMSGGFQPWQWCIGLLKASTTCFSIIPATALTSSLSASIWVARWLCGGRWRQHTQVFLHTSSERDRPRPERVKESLCTVCTGHSKRKNRNGRSFFFSSHSAVLQLNMVLPRFDQIGCTSSPKLPL